LISGLSAKKLANFSLQFGQLVAVARGRGLGWTPQNANIFRFDPAITIADQCSLATKAASPALLERGNRAIMRSRVGDATGEFFQWLLDQLAGWHGHDAARVLAGRSN
jgi:hypothetical protein